MPVDASANMPLENHVSLTSIAALTECPGVILC